MFVMHVARLLMELGWDEDEAVEYAHWVTDSPPDDGLAAGDCLALVAGSWL